MYISANDARAYLGSLLFSVDYAFAEAERQFKQAIGNEPGNQLYLLLICQLYQKKIEYTNPDSEPAYADETGLRNYAQMGLKSLAQKPIDSWTGNDYRYQGEFQLFLARYDEAKVSFDKAAELHPDLIEARVGQGTACHKRKKWDDALQAFQQANRLDTSDLNIRCSMAEVMIEVEQFGLAEEQLTYVRRATENRHVDALILLGKLYARLGDKARANDDNNEAAGRYREAISFLSEVLKADQYGNYSRKITPYECNTVRYLNGYCQVRQLQSREKKEGLLTRLRFARTVQQDINKALEQFKEITKFNYAHNLFEARQAIGQLIKYKKEMSPVEETGSLKGLFVAIVACGVLIVAQLFFWGREWQWVRQIAQPTAEYHIQPSLVQRTIQLDSLGKINLAIFSRKSFADTKELIAEWEKTMGNATIIEHDWIKNQSPAPKELLTEGFYMSITFIALLFVIAGLVLPELTRLKIGNIELEKAKLETITTTSSLNISSGSTASPR